MVERTADYFDDSTPKHRLPSLPRPAFRIREEESVVVLSNQGQPRTRTDESLQVVIPEPSRRLRGPWDHSGSINISVDVDQLLPRLNRAMIVLRG